MKTKPVTFVLYFGNRGFCPEAPIAPVRQEMTSVLRRRAGICRSSRFRHPVGLTPGHVAPAVREAFTKYLGYELKLL